MKSTTILLVEDNADDEILTLLALKKNNIGDKVFVAHDGVEALDFLLCRGRHASRDPHDLPRLTLLDIGLPKLDGLEVLRRLRADKRTQLLPIVVFSSSNEKQDLIEGYKSGATPMCGKRWTSLNSWN
jgi:two-component system response regulator